MSDLIKWPFVRQTYAGIDNPIFVDDIQAADEAILAAAKALSGLTDGDFAIVSGLDWDESTNYSSGIFFLFGNFYYIAAGCQTTQFLTGGVKNTLFEPFIGDGVSRPIYSLYQGFAQDVGGGTSPQFNGSMDQYRISGKRLMLAVNALNTVAGMLKGAAFMDVGTGAGTVAAGNDPRMPYTADQLDARFAQRVNVIEKGTATAYTPVSPFDPTNKNYVDSTGIRVLASGTFNPGPIPGGILDTVVSLGVNVGTNNYDVLISLQSINSNVDIDNFHEPLWYNPSAIQFSLHLHQATAGSHNIIVHWKVIANN